MSSLRFDDEHEHDDSERWLLTYADMITLLLALFIVMFAMSSVNATKFQSLSDSLKDAFNGKILGGESIQQTGESVQAEQTGPEPPQNRVQAMTSSTAAGRLEQTDFRKLKAEIDKMVAEQGLTKKVETAIEKRGLAVRVLTDGLLFHSGSADVNEAATPLLTKIGVILSHGSPHPVRVEGHTDDIPISGRFPSNWELASARASGVVRVLLGTPLKSNPFEAVGRASLDPIGSNDTDSGRAKNRRVEIILPRQHAEPAPQTPGELAAGIRPDHSPSTATEGNR
ncbi:MAG: flagellar motor protein MotB [Actinomycetota bacterium]|nr:flagellar motor protein MotB [Actinomycetota bacterium]MDQ5808877.1 flagellar motor protein MotB [Actinomycetota bacterium]